MSNEPNSRPALAVFANLFPSPARPQAGGFIRERMFRVGRELPVVVISPQAWFPFQGLIRRWRPHFRPSAPRHETQQGIEVYRPRFFSVPGVFKGLDGLFMALGSWPTLRRLRRQGRVDIIDAHFAYPDGYAATLLGRWLGLPVTITLRGTEVPLARTGRRGLMLDALRRASRVFSVAQSLKDHVVGLGAEADKIRVVGNGVATETFHPVAKDQARRDLELPADAPVLVSVGGLTERKGFHRVIETLPALRQRFPGLRYLVVGAAGPEGDWRQRLAQQVAELGLEECVHFLGAYPSDALKGPLSAADVFVLATRNEGWANVFLEAMACGLPVVTTRVGGNPEVIAHEGLGTLVPFGDRAALETALAEALERDWDRGAIIDYARDNAWDKRVAVLVDEFRALSSGENGRTAVQAWGGGKL